MQFILPTSLLSSLAHTTLPLPNPTMGCTKLFLASAVVAALLISAKSQEIEDEHEFSYDPHSENGPHNWGEIHEEWAACGKGEMQSPIDLSDKQVQINPLLGPLRQAYRPAEAVLKNRGHDIMLKWEGDAGKITIDRKDYALKQVHWHSPSEHTIRGNRFSLEIHLVHESEDKKIAVVGILYKIGRPDPFIAKIEKYIKKLGELEEPEVEVGIINPSDIKRGGIKYYRYMGSLTTPPCTEGVIWTIVKKVQTVSKEQLHLLKDAVHDDFSDNARPVQPINGRAVALYRPLKVNEMLNYIV